MALRTQLTGGRDGCRLAGRSGRATSCWTKEISERLHLGKLKRARTNLHTHEFMNGPQTDRPQIKLGAGGGAWQDFTEGNEENEGELGPGHNI